MNIESAPRIRQHSSEYEEHRLPTADSDTYSRIASQSYLESDAVKRLHKRKKRRKVLSVLGISLLVILLVGGGVAFAYMNNLSKSLSTGVDNMLLEALVPTDTPEDPFYVLLLGIDGSAVRDAEGFDGGVYRSDSLMLARVDPKDKKATLVSIPRDTRVDMGEYGINKINSANALGGPALAVKTVSGIAGVPIAHYAEINFDGLTSIVDTLGGIEVDVPIEINDKEAGGHLDSGRQTLSGEQALILCRSRHSYDKYGAGDLYRAANQRVVLSAIAHKLLSADAFTIANSVQSLAGCVTTDLSVDAIVGIAQSMRGMDSSTDIYTAVLPTTSEYTDGAWYEIMDEAAWKTMMKRIDSGLSPTSEDEIDDATGTVIASSGSGNIGTGYAVDRTSSIRIRNGNGTDGVCSDAQKVLEDMGYRKFDLGNADNFNYETTRVVYKESKNQKYAEQIVEAFGLGEVVKDHGEYLFDSDFLIVIGADWKI